MCTFFQWPQDIGREFDNTYPFLSTENHKNPTTMRPRLQSQAAHLNCPRCKSSNTKFCYYNNYSISQPRYLCKACKRYWTVGGILRNVPVGGGSRKTKTPSSSSNSSSSNSNTKKKVITNMIHDHDGLGRTQNLDFNNPLPCNGNLGFDQLNFRNPYNPDNYPFMSMPVCDPHTVFSSSSSYDYMDHDVKPSSSFSSDGLENGYGNNFQENVISSTVIFPFDEELNPISISDHRFEQDRDSTGCWNGMVNGGSW